MLINLATSNRYFFVKVDMLKTESHFPQSDSTHFLYSQDAMDTPLVVHHETSLNSPERSSGHYTNIAP